MTYKEFCYWCDERASDGCWGPNTAIRCIEIIRAVQAVPFWKRKKEWEKHKTVALTELVIPTNKKIRELLGVEVRP